LSGKAKERLGIADSNVYYSLKLSKHATVESNDFGLQDKKSVFIPLIEMTPFDC